MKKSEYVAKVIKACSWLKEDEKQRSRKLPYWGKDRCFFRGGVPLSSSSISRNYLDRGYLSSRSRKMLGIVFFWFKIKPDRQAVYALIGVIIPAVKGWAYRIKLSVVITQTLPQNLWDAFNIVHVSYCEYVNYHILL